MAQIVCSRAKARATMRTMPAAWLGEGVVVVTPPARTTCDTVRLPLEGTNTRYRDVVFQHAIVRRANNRWAACVDHVKHTHNHCGATHDGSARSAAHSPRTIDDSCTDARSLRCTDDDSPTTDYAVTHRCNDTPTAADTLRRDPDPPFVD
jgi:hypothetical protein